jgi:PadR family transcriptional regulator, regulatory protein PadR
MQSHFCQPDDCNGGRNQDRNGLETRDTAGVLPAALRRGSLVLAVLSALRKEQYGYTLRKTLADQGMAIDEGTLYPLLRRLESQGLLVSEWREEEKRNKRFYRLSSDGKAILKQLLAKWQSINSSLDGIV